MRDAMPRTLTTGRSRRVERRHQGAEHPHPHGRDDGQRRPTPAPRTARSSRASPRGRRDRTRDRAGSPRRGPESTSSHTRGTRATKATGHSPAGGKVSERARPEAATIRSAIGRAGRALRRSRGTASASCRPAGSGVSPGSSACRRTPSPGSGTTRDSAGSAARRSSLVRAMTASSSSSASASSAASCLTRSSWIDSTSPPVAGSGGTVASARSASLGSSSSSSSSAASSSRRFVDVAHRVAHLIPPRGRTALDARVSYCHCSLVQPHGGMRFDRRTNAT